MQPRFGGKATIFEKECLLVSKGLCLFYCISSVVSVSKLNGCLEAYVKGPSLSTFPLCFFHFREKEKEVPLSVLQPVHEKAPEALNFALYCLLQNLLYCEYLFCSFVLQEGSHVSCGLPSFIWHLYFSFPLGFPLFISVFSLGFGGFFVFLSSLEFRKYPGKVGSIFGRLATKMGFSGSYSELGQPYGGPSLWFARLHGEDDGDAPFKSLRMSNHDKPLINGDTWHCQTRRLKPLQEGLCGSCFLEKLISLNLLMYHMVRRRIFFGENDDVASDLAKISFCRG